MRAELTSMPSIGFPLPLQTLPAADSPISDILWKVYSVLHHVRHFWSYYRRVEAALDDKNTFWLGLGEVAKFCVGDSKLFCIAAQIAAIGARWILVAKEWEAFQEAGRNLADAWSGPLSPPPLEWEASGSILPPSLVYNVEDALYRTAVRVSAVARHLILFAIRTFVLSMRLLDLYEAILLQPNSEHGKNEEEAMKREFFINILLIEKELDLLEFFENNEETIKVILDNIAIKGLDVSYENLFGVVRSSTVWYRGVKASLGPAAAEIRYGLGSFIREIHTFFRRVFG